jgi:hypothetical protein
VQEIIAQKNRDEGGLPDYSKMDDYEFKRTQMEQQVCRTTSRLDIHRANTFSRSKFCSSRTRLPRLGRGWVRCASYLTLKSEVIESRWTASLSLHLRRWSLFSNSLGCVDICSAICQSFGTWDGV